MFTKEEHAKRSTRLGLWGDLCHKLGFIEGRVVSDRECSALDNLAKQVSDLQHQVGVVGDSAGRVTFVEGKALNPQKAARLVPELTADLLKRSIERLEREKSALLDEVKRLVKQRDQALRDKEDCANKCAELAKELVAERNRVARHLNDIEALERDLERANRHVGAKERSAADQLCYTAEQVTHNGGDIRDLHSAIQRYRAHRQWAEPGVLDRSDQ